MGFEVTVRTEWAKWRWDKTKTMEKNDEGSSWFINHRDRRIRAECYGQNRKNDVEGYERCRSCLTETRVEILGTAAKYLTEARW
jgi:hypothetical protein